VRVGQVRDLLDEAAKEHPALAGTNAEVRANRAAFDFFKVDPPTPHTLRRISRPKPPWRRVVLITQMRKMRSKMRSVMAIESLGDV